MNTFIALFCLSLMAIPALAATPDQQSAVATLEQNVKANPNNAELWVHLGFAYRKADQLDQAQSAFQKALSLKPKSREALSMLALIYEKKQQKTEALRLWKSYAETETDPHRRDMAEKHIHQLSQ
jgi:cytochrome c-type biogenesis protein CcmH/NrfG